MFAFFCVLDLAQDLNTKYYCPIAKKSDGGQFFDKYICKQRCYWLALMNVMKACHRFYYLTF